MEELFGSLRSHLSAQHRDVDWRWALWSLLQEAHAQDAARYQEQWVPYLSAQTFWQEAPLARFHDVEEYRKACKVAPFATFALNYSEHMDYEQYEELLENYASHELKPSDIPLAFVRLDQVSELVLNVYGEDEFDFERWGLCTWPEYLMHQAKYAKLKQLKTLHIGSDCGLKGHRYNVLELINASDFPQVEVFEFDSSDRRVRVLDSLQTDFVEKLKALHISGPGFAEGEVARLCERADLSRLEALTLTGAKLTDAELSALCQAASLKALRKLSLYRAELSGEDLSLLASAPFIERLEDLDIYGMELDEGFAAFLSAEALRSLKSLRVTSVTHWELIQLRVQDEPDEQVTLVPDPSWRALTLRTKHTHVEFWSALLGDEALSFRLKALSLATRVVTLEALDALLSAPSCAELEHLELVLPDDPSEHEALLCRLAQHPAPFKSLNLAHLSYRSSLSFEAMQVLIEAEAFAQLEALSVKIAKERLDGFRESFGHLKRLTLY